MIKTEVFKVSLADKQSVIIPKLYAEVFYKLKQNRIKVKANFNSKTIEFYAALRREKTGVFRIYFSKTKQKELNLTSTDNLEMQLSEDTTKYGVIPCEEFEAVMLTDYEAYNIFEALTPGKRRSIIYAINRYKSSQTRIE
ncbi:bacteriocin resistance YdeI/OmpD-like protein [Winogradskyella wandonensis]|uniref:Bacteriocin resistance YdeI/OmpD-like protein n=1 Tax=Winogradskyella wandonensis TaxID=1442586 RepID=A0A4R1KVW9_9FLAO|nr:YdeI/OmpD-associated family protein [Winogradskyella wandonensis]TCK68867.1 bacteriocin resistance YdeI/OmpD-like protein [Winogradskyella wandonensis]